MTRLNGASGGPGAQAPGAGSGGPPGEPITVETGGLRFACLAAGNPGDPLALCLHGFPDTAHSWRHLMPQLAAAGYYAVAPFMRGYAPTEVPADGLYQTGALVRDVNALHDALGGGSDAVLIGHDWGALAAYGAAAHRPGYWRKVVTGAVPPTQSIMGSFFSYDQLRRSWYTFFFQTAFAEMAIPLDDWHFIDRLWADWSPGYDARWDVARVKESIGTPERMLAAISYYRALYNPALQDESLAEEQAATLAPTRQQTLYLHGDADGCFALHAIGEPLLYLAPGSEMAVIAGAGHFLHLERPDEVNGHILRFLGR